MSFRRSRSLQFALSICTLAGFLAACGGGRSGLIPGDSSALQSADAIAAHGERGASGTLDVTPFKPAAKSLGTIAGQPVYALFKAPKVAIGGSTTTPAVSVYGAAVTGGNAGPISEIVVTSSTEKQHTYLDGNDRLVEFSDASTSALLLVKYPSSSESVTTVCRSGKELGTIEEIVKDGKTETTFKDEKGDCPGSVTAAAAPSTANAEAQLAAASATAPSAANLTYYACRIDASPFPALEDRLAKAAKFISSLDALSTAYGKLTTAFDPPCAKKAIDVAAAATAPAACSGASCIYQAPPVPIVVETADCPTKGLDITFYAPDQKCTLTVSGDAGSDSEKYTVESSDPSVVSITPASGTVKGKYSLKLSFVAADAGGSASVTYTLKGSNPDTVHFAVANDWATSATPEPTSTPTTSPTSSPSTSPSSSPGIVNGNFATGSLAPWYACNFVRNGYAAPVNASPAPQETPTQDPSPTATIAPAALSSLAAVVTPPPNLNANNPGAIPALGSYVALAGSTDSETSGTAGICQKITVNSVNKYLSFYAYEGGAEYNFKYGDQEADILDSTGTTLKSTLFAELNCFWDPGVVGLTGYLGSGCIPASDGGTSTYTDWQGGYWVQRGPYDLSSYAGQTVTLFIGVWDLYADAAPATYSNEIFVGNVQLTSSDTFPTSFAGRTSRARNTTRP